MIPCPWLTIEAVTIVYFGKLEQKPAKPANDPDGLKIPGRKLRSGSA
jgi:hypothetical protein